MCTKEWFFKLFPKMPSNVIGYYDPVSHNSYTVVNNVDDWNENVIREHYVGFHEFLHPADYDFDGNAWSLLYLKCPERDTHHYGRDLYPLQYRINSNAPAASAACIQQDTSP